MKKLTSRTSIADRIVANVELSDATFSGGSGVFVLARNATLKAGAQIASGTFSAYTDEPCTVVGEFVAIELPGIRFRGTKIHHVLPALPGDLSYIDGCSNSNLISPPRNGDPCTNYLYFPPGIDQTHHTHPSFRLGMVMSGKGVARIGNTELPLLPGDVFFLPRFERHGFATGDEAMSLMVFHPDSDDGPTDEHNPMKGRTYL